jgi:hypothetical protein
MGSSCFSSSGIGDHAAIDDVGDGANDIPSIVGRMTAIIGPCAKARTVIRHLVFKLVVTTHRDAYLSAVNARIAIASGAPR